MSDKIFSMICRMVFTA